MMWRCWDEFGCNVLACNRKKLDKSVTHVSSSEHAAVFPPLLILGLATLVTACFMTESFQMLTLITFPIQHSDVVRNMLPRTKFLSQIYSMSIAMTFMMFLCYWLILKSSNSIFGNLRNLQIHKPSHESSVYRNQIWKQRPRNHAWYTTSFCINVTNIMTFFTMTIKYRSWR